MAVSGISGGTIDVAGIVSQLMEVERAPLAKIQKDLSGIQTKLSAWGKIQSAVSSLRDATTAMTRFDAWRGAKASSNDETILAATGGTGAAAGNYSFTVEKLAQSQSVVSAGFAASDTVVGGGTLHIQLGAVDQGGNVFTADPARPAIDVVIPADATLADIRSAINNADAGVSATILGDGANKRLVLTSTESGRQHAFEITATDADGDDTDASGISAFASSATAASGANGTQRTQAARDAELTVNGLAITAGSNRVTDVIEGVTLTLKKTTATPVEVAIGNDQEASRALVDQFVTAYNALNSVITEQTRYDAASKIAGTLQGNSIAVRIQQQLRSQVSTNSAADTTGSLSSAGFKIARDSSLSIDEAGMAALLADPARLKTLFSGKAASGDQPATGIARLLDAQLATFLDANGAVTGATDALRARQGAIEKQQERFEDRMVDVEARLTRQYSALDVNLAKITNSFAAIQSLLPKE